MVVAKKLDGRRAAQTLLRHLARQTARRHLRLAIVQIGDRTDSSVYIRQKQRAAEQVGIFTTLHHLPTRSSQVRIVRLIKQLNAQPSVHGILLQLPVPSHLDADQLITVIRPTKDVDGFHPEQSLVQPPLVSAVLHLVRLAKPRHGAAVILGRVSVFSHALQQILARRGWSVQVDLATKRIPSITKNASLILTVRGRGPKLLGRHMRHGAVVIDAGIRRFEGKVTGDVDASAWSAAGAISPVPGGVGPLTVAYTLKNLVMLAQKNNGAA